MCYCLIELIFVSLYSNNLNEMKRGKKRKPLKKKSRSNYRLGCIITIIVLIPILYGLYLYCQQQNTLQSKESQATVSQQIPPSKDLETPLLLSPRQEQIIHHTGYTVSYNKDLKLPNWVSYELTREETKGKEKRNNRFIADPQVIGAIATNGDYTRSGYDKGHMAPAADMKWSPKAMEESFYFSNMCPQHPQLNRRGWKILEDKIRDWAVADSAIIVICGPIVDKHPKTIGKNKVTVPQQFFKVILSPFAKPVRGIGFLFNNEQATLPLSSYVVTIDSIEHLTNMDFFSSLPDEIETKIEAETNYSQWPH